MARRARRGANAIEFALLFPVFTWLMTGVIDYGWLFTIRSVAAHAIHEGARAGAVTLVKDDPAAVATSTLEDRLKRSGFSLSTKISATVDGKPPDAYVQVELYVELQPLVGLVPVPRSYTTTAVMRLEDQS
ncbi:MAG: TadE family protein [Myxococcota bacterium]